MLFEASASLTQHDIVMITNEGKKAITCTIALPEKKRKVDENVPTWNDTALIENGRI